MNHMAEVAKMLGVELKERFKIIDGIGVEPDDYYYFANEGLVTDNGYLQEENLLLDLLLGYFTIKRKPWKPNDGERYWYVDERGRIWSDYFDYYSCTSHCMNYYKLGNCYRTREEAEANRDKWVKFYASDEVLEV